MKQLTALLPMKGHSERVPNKNMKLFCGYPLYHRIVTVLLNAKSISSIVINTDSDVIKEDVKKNFDNLTLIDRPVDIQGDYVPMNDIISHDISELEGDYFLQTHSTNPLLKSSTIDKAVELFFNNLNNYDSLFSVTKLQARLFNKLIQPINHNPQELIRTQDLEPLYEENSNFYIFSRKSFFESGNNRIGLTPNTFSIDKTEAIDIDDEQDFLLAETIFGIKNEIKK